jgi:hypothetical protein
MAKKKATGTAVANIQAEIAAKAAAISNTVGGGESGNRLRTTQGKEFVDPGDNRTRGPIQLVIIDHNTHNQYYPNPFDKDNPEPPVCYAMSEPASQNGDIRNLVPCESAPDKQAEACNPCLMNQFGSAANGKGKACKNSYMLITVNPDADDPTECALLSLNVSPSGLKRYASYVRTLSAKGLLPVSVITEIRFDDAVDYPSLMFREAGPNPQLAEHYARIPEAQAMLMEEPELPSTDAPSDTAKRPARKPATRKKAASRRSA